MYITEIERECSRSNEPEWMDDCTSNMDETTSTYVYGILTHIESYQQSEISS